ncbi:hypothetical protein DVA81_18970, partial [Acinetobacter baumannii]
CLVSSCSFQTGNMYSVESAVRRIGLGDFSNHITSPHYAKSWLLLQTEGDNVQLLERQEAITKT